MTCEEDRSAITFSALFFLPAAHPPDRQALAGSPVSPLDVGEQAGALASAISDLMKEQYYIAQHYLWWFRQRFLL